MELWTEQLGPCDLRELTIDPHDATTNPPEHPEDPPRHDTRTYENAGPLSPMS
jgi:hypothetical protein